MATAILLYSTLLFFVLLPFLSIAGEGEVSVEFIYLNSAATSLHFVGTGGFLASCNAAFHAAIRNPGGQQSRFYLTIVHASTDSIVWSANRDAPVSSSGRVSLSAAGLMVSRPDGLIAWSTPGLRAPVAALQLLDTGNLRLVDVHNATLWQSFDDPTDTLLPGQLLRSGTYLSSPVSDSDLSESDYQLAVTSSSAVMLWRGSQQYWSISTDPRAIKQYNAEITYMAINATGLYLFSGLKAVFIMILPPAEFRIAKMDSTGRFRIMRNSTTSSSGLEEEFVAPSGGCDLPFACRSLGLCTVSSNGSACTCPRPLGSSHNGSCLLSDGSSLTSSSSCNGGESTATSYVSLEGGIDYFANKFASPISSGKDKSLCQSHCNSDCSCLGFFYKNSSGSCYLLKNHLGSFFNVKAGEPKSGIGYIKMTPTPSASPPTDRQKASPFRLAAILLPTLAAVLLVIILAYIGILWYRSIRNGSMKEFKLCNKSWFRHAEMDGEDEEIFIPGLPARFSYAEIEAATGRFMTRIGSGGFGEVFSGELADGTPVAVKRINKIGRREFCTEIATIGTIHHVNLVRLIGFCAQGPNRLLVYEYMSRGSLDRVLFGGEPVLGWAERGKIAVDAAYGLAYLHSGCEHKIIHCDIKPENILIHEAGPAKISDFGLAKLLSRDQSGQFTTMRGTRGYLAPEWLTRSAISDKTDVYSFGMVLLEIVSGKKNRAGSNGSSSSDGPSGSGDYFPLVAWEMHERGQYVELADPRLEGMVVEEEVKRMVKTALCCLHEEPALRPSMAAVAGMLEGTTAVWEPRIDSLKFLRIYGRGSAIGLDGLLVGGNLALPPVNGAANTASSSAPPHMSGQQLSGPR